MIYFPKMAVLVMFLSLFLSGCVIVEKIDSLNGILEDPIPDSEVAELRNGEEAFFAGNFEESMKIFTDIYNNSEKKMYRNYATYGVACTKMMTAESSEELKKAIEMLKGWQEPQAEIIGFWENPRLISEAMNKQLYLLESEPQIKYVTLKQKSNGLAKKQKKEIKELKETIKKLQHQISVLEAIDQEIQEKRKPI